MILNRFSCFLRCAIPLDDETTFSACDTFPQLTSLKLYWDLSKTLEEKVLHVQQFLDFGSEDIRDEMILVLRGAVDTLRSHHTETLTDSAESHSVPRKKRRKVASSAGIAANFVYQALVESSKACSSIHNHDYGVRLRLATYRKAVEEHYAFEAFVTHNTINKPWQEMKILALLAEHEMQRKMSVKFASNDSNGNEYRSRRFAVERLCEQIEKLNLKPSMRLNLIVEDGRLWKNQSCRSLFPIKRADPPLSLEDIIVSHPASLTEKVKRVLAILLAYTVLHFHGTPWLRRTRFNGSNILFFHTSSALPLKPYIHTDLMEIAQYPEKAPEESYGLEADIDPDDLPFHPYPDIIMLAIMLMELYMVQPIQSLAERAGIEIAGCNHTDENTKYSVAVAVFDRFQVEFPDNYREAVDRCLDLNIGIDQKDQELDETGLKRLIYEEIVQPLEDELDQGFGNTVSIDNLDEVAQNLDLSSWGQMRTNKLFPKENISAYINPQRSMNNTFQMHSDSCIFNASIKQKETARERNQSGPSFNEKLLRTQPASSQGTNLPCFSHQDYSVGWICALPKEMAAAKAMLDETHPPLSQDPSDQNNYALGRIGLHNVAIACLPTKIIGTISAARVSSHMLYTFKSLRFGLLVGVGGGVPGSKDLRLGDVVVAEAHESTESVIQYDFGKTIQHGEFFRTGSLNRSPDILLTAISRLKADHYLKKPMLETYLKEMEWRHPLWNLGFSHPGRQYDVLFQCDYDHFGDKDEEFCQKCDMSKTIHRAPRDSLSPHIHYGPIASGNQVMRDGATRDRLRKKHNILCFEMEAAGLVDAFPCLVIRGICDYSDSHKNKKWQGYAAATAAAYAKELLSVIPGNQVQLSVD